VRGRLALASEDGRVDGSWPGVLYGYLDAAREIEKAEFALDATGQLPPVTSSNLASVYGLPQAEGAGFDGLSFSLVLSLSPTSAATMGELRLNGLTFAECAQQSPEPQAPEPQAPAPMGTTPGGTAGCAGAEATELLAGVITGG
jgi:hypothetical protein